MNIPRFTAEASLYNVDRNYNMGAVKPAQSCGAVELAALIGHSHKDFCTACEESGGVCIRTPHGNFCV